MNDEDLDMSLFYSDYLHLSKKGNMKLSKHIVQSVQFNEKASFTNPPSKIFLRETSQLNEQEFPPLPKVKTNSIPVKPSVSSKYSCVPDISHSHSFNVCSKNVSSICNSSVVNVSHAVKHIKP